MATTAVTDASFQSDVLESDKPVLVDFWADWCGPCKMIAPALEELSEELGDKVTIAKMEGDHRQDGHHGKSRCAGFDGRPVDPLSGVVQEWRTGSADARCSTERPAQAVA